MRMRTYVGLLMAVALSLGLCQAASGLGDISTFAGGGVSGLGDGGPATDAQMSFVRGVAFDAAGNVFFADSGLARIRKVDSNGIITTVAGNGVCCGFSGDGGPATSAQLQTPVGIAFDGAGNLFIVDGSNHRIRKVDSNGIITTVVGTTQGFSGDGGPATSARLSIPDGIAFDGSGNLFIGDRGNNRIRKVDTSGIITTVVGTGVSGFSGDGGPATSARLFAPLDVAFDGAGNLFIADVGNFRIRKVDTNGIITTVAGNGVRGFSGDGGPATSAQFFFPSAIAFDGAGNLFITDQQNARIRKVDTNGIISTVVGTGVSGFSGDGGPAASAQLAGPDGIAFDGVGNLFIGDQSNRRIRKVFETVAPVVTVTPLTTSDSRPALMGSIDDAGATVSVTVDGQVNAATNNGSTWSLADNVLLTLPAGTYDVQVTATDAALNVGTDATTNELIIQSSGSGGGQITSNLTAGQTILGARLELTAPGGFTDYRWKKDGAPMADGGNISGTATQVLVIDPLSLADAGVYTVQYENGIARAVVETDGFVVVVLEAVTLPAASWWALLATLVSLLVAAAVLRRWRRASASTN